MNYIAERIFLQMNSSENRNYLRLFLWLLLAANLAEVIYCLFGSGQILTDDIEHLHASFLVFSGYIPYRDFFEHHHPLLWYILAPIIGILPHNTLLALYVGRLISLSISLVSGGFVYLIGRRFLGGKTTALFCLNLYFWGAVMSASSLYNIKPDIWMRCCFWGGVYYLFCYFRYCRFRDLQISTLLFCGAFLFLQSCILHFVPLSFAVAYFLFKHPQRVKDFLLASIAPLALLLLAYALLHNAHAWERYFELNWLYNSLLTKYMHAYLQSYRIAFFADLLLLALASVYFLYRQKKFNIYNVSLLLLLIFEVLQRLFFVSASFHYYAMMVISAALIVAPVVYKLWLTNLPFRWCFGGLCLFHLLINPFIEHSRLQIDADYDRAEYCLTLLCGVYTKPLVYYWTYPSLEAIDDIYFQYLKDYDINKLLDNSGIEHFKCQENLEEIFAQVTAAFDFNSAQQKILNRHHINPQKLRNYEEIAPNLYQRKAVYLTPLSSGSK